MARTGKRLSALEVNRLSKAGKHPIGDSIYLQISKTGTKSWLFRYSKNGKSTWMGLGSARVMSIADVRAKAFELHRQLLDGINPLAKKIEVAKAAQLLEAKKMTFDDCSIKFLEAHSPRWKNEKHVLQWSSTLKTYASPIIGHLPVQDIDTALVMNVLEKIWYEKTETASRLRGRMERILSWAAVREYRSHENPARWRGHLDQLLPKRSEIQKVEHFKALPISEVNTFIQKLRKEESVSSLALEFVILTVTRTNETLKAKWSEFNFQEKSWLIPGERMKAGKDHKIPLTKRMLEILHRMKSLFPDSEYVFESTRTNSALSDMSLLMMIRRLGYEATTHGMRSSFSDWAGDKTNFPRDLVEMALAHAIPNKVEAAYRRSDMFEKRRRLMDAWENYCNQTPIKTVVVDFNARMA